MSLAQLYAGISVHYVLVLARVTIYLYVTMYIYIGAGVVVVFAIPLAVIIISDCFCQQWLDRTYKVTNPIKLIIQVLNYTRRHSYPERRSAFTYIDEEQPTRMDYGKERIITGRLSINNTSNNLLYNSSYKMS